MLIEPSINIKGNDTFCRTAVKSIKLTSQYVRDIFSPVSKEIISKITEVLGTLVDISVNWNNYSNSSSFGRANS
ncbi:MAG: hypothetical protein LBI26_03040 [Holosporales bacterium]|nr:hypothetical protein [Holosporales bacterium]